MSSILAIQWFRCETNLDIVQAEIREMEADFHNLQTDATQVGIHFFENEILSNIPIHLDFNS